jgi:hypothetical protein
MGTKRSTKSGLWPLMRKLHSLRKLGLVRSAQARPIPLRAAARSDRHTIVALALIVVLLIVNFILRFPDLGAIIAQYNLM